MRRMLLTFLAAALASGAVLSQDLSPVTVTASRISSERVGQTSSGVPVYEVSMTYRVSYEDLDLGTSEGATALEDRVRAAARDACAEIDRQYPKAEPSGPVCVTKAVEEAMVDVGKAVAAAR